MTHAPEIVRFYGGQAPDHRGRFVGEIQGWPDDRLERVHDFIQWLFPLEDPSPVNPAAPTLDLESIGHFRSTPELQANLRRSFVRMLKFYGFEVSYLGQAKVARGANFEERAGNWLTAGNHNHLRITRILKSLSLLGLRQDADAFFHSLSDVYNEQSRGEQAISGLTFSYWTNAIR